MSDNSFSDKRFLLLAKQALRLNKKLIGAALAGVASTIFVALLLFQALSNFRNWQQAEYFVTFIIFFLLLGIIYACLSFPAFRSKARSIDFLMLPASTLEKFIFEFIVRIFAFVVLMPVIFWIVANLEAAIVHHYVPKLPDSDFSFSEGWADLTNNIRISGWQKFMIIQACLLVLIGAFTGSVHFSRSPLIKTLFAFSLVLVAYILYAYLLFKGLDLENFVPENERVLFIHNEEQANAFFALAALIVNMSLIAMSWSRLKEKEA
jgi:hypothetical protein